MVSYCLKCRKNAESKYQKFISNVDFIVIELHKPVLSKFEKRKVNLSFIGNIWGADLADMQLISKFNKAFRFLLSVIDI